MNTHLESVKRDAQFRKILGIRFFIGQASDAIDILRDGGLLVVPAAPALKNLVEDIAYREALLAADLAIADSSLMVLTWNFMQKDHIRRLSGLEYLKVLLTRGDVRRSGQCFWIMPSVASAATNLAWLREQNILVPAANVFVAPFYGPSIKDEDLLMRIRESNPAHVIIALGGGTQERLGLYLKKNLSRLPAIHCIGAAIGFLSGDQVRIPAWADHLYLGWLFRCVWQPRSFIPRYWSACRLVSLMKRYRTELPNSKNEESDCVLDAARM